jgi:hypothetical protein
VETEAAIGLALTALRRRQSSALPIRVAERPDKTGSVALLSRIGMAIAKPSQIDSRPLTERRGCSRLRAVAIRGCQEWKGCLPVRMSAGCPPRLQCSNKGLAKVPKSFTKRKPKPDGVQSRKPCGVVLAPSKSNLPQSLRIREPREIGQHGPESDRPKGSVAPSQSAQQPVPTSPFFDGIPEARDNPVRRCPSRPSLQRAGGRVNPVKLLHRNRSSRPS